MAQNQRAVRYGFVSSITEVMGTEEVHVQRDRTTDSVTTDGPPPDCLELMIFYYYFFSYIRVQSIIGVA